MRIDPADLGDLTDEQVRQLAGTMALGSRDASDPAAPFWAALARAVVRAHRERRREFYALVLALDDDDQAEGAIVGSADDDMPP